MRMHPYLNLGAADHQLNDLANSAISENTLPGHQNPVAYQGPQGPPPPYHGPTKQPLYFFEPPPDHGHQEHCNSLPDQVKQYQHQYGSGHGYGNPYGHPPVHWNGSMMPQGAPQYSYANQVPPSVAPDFRKRARDDDDSGQNSKRTRALPTVIDLTAAPDENVQPHNPRVGLFQQAVNRFDQAQAQSVPQPSKTPLDDTSKKQEKAKKKKRKKTPREPELCQEQQDLVDLIVSGRNVFYTGSAGCGKSTVLRAFVQKLKEAGKEVRIAAPTGRAAVDIGGQTLYAYAGLTPDSLKEPLEKLKHKGWQKSVNKRLKETDVLVIDEISMVENHFLERVSEIMKVARGGQKPFGGVQVVFLGDFYQLPPVKPFQYCITCGRLNQTIVQNRLYKCPQHGEYLDSDKWAFCAKAWEEANFTCVNLTSIHRQKDKKFIAILEKCRTAQRLSPQEKHLLLHHRNKVDNPVRLFATREEVRILNESEFAKLNTPQRTVQCLDGIRLQEHHARGHHFKQQRNPNGTLVALKEHRFEPVLEMKTGMLVILLVNLDMEAGLINGSQGKIIGWQPHGENMLPIPFDSSKKLRDANPSRPIIGGDHAQTRLDCIKKFAADMLPTKEWPVVKFDNGVTRPVIAECQLSEFGDEQPYSYLARTQIPLLPAWAMSIHKSQGMTLSKVIVNLARSFEEGQMYVALSRAKSLMGLKVEALGSEGSGPNPEVEQFLERLFGKKRIEEVDYDAPDV